MAGWMNNETNLESHYEFGKNWARFAAALDESRIGHAVDELERLVPRAEMAGASFLDVGSGSGLSSLAALRLGAGRVTALDLDPDSVATARAVLARFASAGGWQIQEGSVFTTDPVSMGRFDVVYSWGVLHHTGDMWRAIETCLPMVADAGVLVLALYRKTPWCGFWRREKRFYLRAPRLVRFFIRNLYKLVFMSAMAVHRRNPFAYIKSYGKYRGMSWHTDVEDWLGGYPYDSVSPADLRVFLSARGFVEVRSFTQEVPRGLSSMLGSGCDEFVFRRQSGAESDSGG